MILIFTGGVIYALAAGVVAPAVRNYQLANATPTPTPTVAPVTATPLPSSTADSQAITPTPTLEPGTTPSPTPAPDGKLTGHVIGIDPARGYSSKVQGVSTKIYANRLNFSIAELVKQRLEALGATVVMGLNDVKDDQDAVARATTMNTGMAELALRLECNSVKTADSRGAIVWAPSAHALQNDCDNLAAAVLKAYIAATDFSIAKYNGESIRHKGDETFFNKTEAPVCTLLMGYISSPAEDKLLNDAEFQKKMADGIVKGILDYLGIQ
ncbi:MAG: N-acetylmuramoyl-L-alanine amidase [Clostridia bacterium]